MKKKNICSFIMTFTILSTIFSGCRKKDPSKQDTTPAPTIKVSTENTVPQVTNESGQKTDNDTAAQITKEAVPEVTATAAPQITEPNQPTPKETEIPTDTPDSDKNNVSEYWTTSYLIWLPLFENGTFEGGSYDGTYDYASFNNVSQDAVTAYIDILKKEGFTSDITEKNEGGKISFSAFNKDSWNALLSYDGNSLLIGSGFREQDNDSDEKADILYSTTMLQYVPRFEAGELEKSEVTDDSSMYVYAIYSGVSPDNVKTYISKLKEAGYVYVTYESSKDDSISFIALNDDRFECHVEYDGNLAKIGCGISDND